MTSSTDDTSQDSNAPVSSRSVLVFALALGAALALRPLVYGADVTSVLLHAVFLAGWIVFPGWLCVRAWGFARGDALVELGLGWTLGQALQSLVFFALRVRGLPELSVFAPLVPLTLAALALAVRRGVVPNAAAQRTRWTRGELAVLFVLCLVAIERTTLFSQATWWKDFDRDLFFHAGNAAEYANRWPMCDPRNAASGFNYHVHAYAPAAAARALFGLSTTETMLRLGAAAVPVLLVLQLANAGRAIGGSARAGLVASALVVFASDAGFQLARALGPVAHALEMNAFLGFGVFNSPSTVLGLVYTVTLALVLKTWLDEQQVDGTRSRIALGVLLAVIGLAASGAKGSVMPVVLAALGLAWLVLLVLRRPGARHTFVALVILALAAVPPTLALARGEASYGGAMFRFAPLDTVRSSGFFSALAGATKHTAADAPVVLGWLALPVWIVGYFALAGAGFVAWFARERRSAGALELYLACGALVATVVALALGAPGFSQLFFAYTGQIGLVLLAARAFTNGFVARAWRVPIAIVFGLPFAASAAIAIAGELKRDLTPREATELARAHHAGLAWIRDNTPHDAVLVAKHTEMLESVHAERASFHETELYAPATHARGWKRGPVGWIWEPDYGTASPDQLAARGRFFAHPDAESIARLRAELGTRAGAKAPLYAIFDAVTVKYGGELGSWFEVAPAGAPPEHEAGVLTLVFENAALRVYRIEQTR